MLNAKQQYNVSSSYWRWRHNDVAEKDKQIPVIANKLVDACVVSTLNSNKRYRKRKFQMAKNCQNLLLVVKFSTNLSLFGGKIL